MTKAAKNVLVESVLDLRKIYSSMNDDSFIKWYAKRYKIPVQTVCRILEKSKEANSHASGRNRKAEG